MGDIGRKFPSFFFWRYWKIQHEREYGVYTFGIEGSWVDMQEMLQDPLISSRGAIAREMNAILLRPRTREYAETTMAVLSQ